MTSFLGEIYAREEMQPVETFTQLDMQNVLKEVSEYAEDYLGRMPRRTRWRPKC